MNIGLLSAVAGYKNKGRTSVITSLDQDWITRSTAPGVTYATDFSGVNDFVLASTNGGHVIANGMDSTTLSYVVKDTTDGLTNGCCLRIDTPASVGANTASWMFPFSNNYTNNASNIGNEFWIQFRFKIPDSRLTLTNCGGNQRGWKWLNIAQYSVEDTDSQSFSNTNAEHVLQDTDQRGLPQAYHQTGSNFEPFNGFEGGQITLQTAIDRGAGFSGGNRYCHYPDGTPACEFWPTNEWVTFMVRIKIPTYSSSTGTEFDLFYARRGATQWTQLFNDRGYTVGSPNSSGGGFTHLNGGHFLTYETNRINSTEDTWHKYDQVIVSTQEIAIPAPI